MPTTITARAVTRLDPTQLNQWYRPAPGAGLEIVLVDGSTATVIGARDAGWCKAGSPGRPAPVDLGLMVARQRDWFTVLPGATSYDWATRPAVPAHLNMVECSVTVDGDTQLPVVVRHRAHPTTSGPFCTAHRNEPCEIENPSKLTRRPSLVTCLACLVTYLPGLPGWEQPTQRTHASTAAS